MADIHSKKAPDPVGAYPHAKCIGDWVYLSGVGPRVPGGNAIPGNQKDTSGNLIAYDIEAQTHSVLRNVASVLAEAGCEVADLVDITVFLTNMSQDFTTFNKVYSEYFTDHQPCRTTVEVNALPTEIAVEFKCVAFRGSGGIQ